MTQPTLTQFLKQAEEDPGLAWFIRASQGIELTEIGDASLDVTSVTKVFLYFQRYN